MLALSRLGQIRRFALPCNVTVVAQEKDHNPPKDEKGRVVGTKLVRPKQEESFFSLAIGDSPCGNLPSAIGPLKILPAQTKRMLSVGARARERETKVGLNARRSTWLTVLPPRSRVAT